MLEQATKEEAVPCNSHGGMSADKKGSQAGKT